MMVLLACLALLFTSLSSGSFIDFERIGGIADNNSEAAAFYNQKLLNTTLNSLLPSDVLYLSNKTFTLVGGIFVTGIKNVTIKLDGTLNFTSDRDTWPTDENGNVLECMYFEDIENVAFTSGGKGTYNGNGRPWWGAIKFLVSSRMESPILM